MLGEQTFTQLRTGLRFALTRDAAGFDYDASVQWLWGVVFAQVMTLPRTRPHPSH